MKYFILVVMLILIGCSSKNTSSPGVGYWLDTYFSNESKWQCIEPITPHRNKEC